ncbi:MAG: di-heme oxidoredictase family protein [Acidobacteriota bacterium]
MQHRRPALVARPPWATLCLAIVLVAAGAAGAQDFTPGVEKAVPHHLEDGEEYTVPTHELLEHGRLLFEAMWTAQEGGGRPLTKGTGGDLADPTSPLEFPRSFNRISAPDANSCAGCHNLPRSGGAGDVVANVFVLGQRFDHVTFDPTDAVPTRGALDEEGKLPLLDEVANSRATTGMFGAGYLEMLAREITFDLRAQALALPPGESVELTSKGISFGTLARGADGAWDTSGVEGLAPPSLASSGPEAPPSLIVRPWHQAGAVVSLRQFSNNAFNHHHGIQSAERFGEGTDPDGDGFTDEMTRADVTAVSVFQATLAVPGRVIPRFRPLEEAVLAGEEAFARVGCTECHVPALPLSEWGQFYYEPNPFNPPGNLKPGDAPLLKVNLNSRHLPGPRLSDGPDRLTRVPAYTDFKLHDITSGPDDPNREALNMHFPPSSPEFFAGNGRFLTKRLWGVANTRPYFHHGMYTTLREAILAHAGEAQAVTDAFRALSEYEQGAVVEFLKTLQVLPEGTRHLVVDQDGQPRQWPPPWAR